VFWLAVVESRGERRDVVIAAPSLVEAARVVGPLGRITALGLASTL
jgi:hypothetical protein